MRIIKRKKGSQYYFYLQHSIRKKGRIITKERYLGKEIPKNINQIKERFKTELLEELYKKFEIIKSHFQREWKTYPISIKEKVKEEIAIAFTYNTNAIEGSTITLQETKEIIQDKIAPNKSLNDIKETEAHCKIFLEMLNKKEKITNNILLQWHKEIFKDTKPDIAGKFREYLVRINNYTAPDWQDIKYLMEQFIIFVNKTKMDPVELAARAHYKFEKIHPFGDGNGRIGRLLMNYILWHNHYPMLIIEYKKRRPYYKSLQKDEEGFFNYFIRRYLSVNKTRI
ncbi:Fic family protein [Candidatus Woesearchaeota archaeon]|nr:Fic family protein [Candidatus Woesearchaeota archaeon]